MKYPLSFILLSIFLHSGLKAQLTTPRELSKISGNLVLDGNINELEWENIQPIPLKMLFPEYGGELSERTEIRIGYTETHIWASIKAFDSDPNNIQVNSLYRDRESGDDKFVLILDTFNSDESAMEFTVTPAGTRIDRLILNDSEPGRGPISNQDWNTFWDAEATINQEGWFAEIRIPFSSLRFQSNEGETITMGLRTFRWIPRKGENQMYPLTSPNNATNPWMKPSLAQDITLEGMESSKPIYITPYVLAGSSLNNTLNEPSNNYEPDFATQFDVGGDLKYSLNSNLTLDVTVNTDFAQVEADDQQLNLGRFSLFFPEKRAFFQERSDIFSFSMGGSTRLFYSRNIGLSPTGEPISIYGGTRIVGSTSSGMDIGILSMQTQSYEALPSENFGVLRIRKPIGSGSNAGLMYTHRIGADGTYNYGYGVDSNIRVLDRHQFAIRWAQTFDDQLPHSIDASRFLVRFQKIGREGFLYDSEFVWSGQHYQPDLGFVSARDFKGGFTRLSYGWLPNNKNFREANLNTGFFTRVRNRTNVLEYLNIHKALEFVTSSNSSTSLRFNYLYDDLPEPIRITPNVIIPIGSYTFYNFTAYYQSPSGRAIRLVSNLTAGSFYDGNRVSLEASPTWNVNSHLELGMDYNINLIRFSERDQKLNGHIVRSRINLALNRKVSIGSYLQFNNTSDKILMNTRFRVNFSEGNDLYIVLNGDYNTERVQQDPLAPNLPVTNSGLFLIKYSRTFIK